MRIKTLTAGLMNRAVCVLALVGVMLSPLSAAGRRDVGTSGAQFLKLGVNARAIAMGEAYSAVADGADAIYWNAAGLEQVKGKAFSVMHSAYLQDINHDFAAYAQRMGIVGVVGVGVQYLSANSIDQTDSVGTNVGTFKPSDLAVNLAWAREFSDFGSPFVVGLNGKYVRSRIIETAEAGAVDFGVAWNMYEKWRFGATVQNLGTALKFRDESDDLPVTVRLGSSFTYKKLILSLDGIFPRDNDPAAAVGAEYKMPISQDLWFATRGGFNSRTINDLNKGISSIGAGAGLGWKTYSVDFAWVPFGNLGNTYRISLSAKF